MEEAGRWKSGQTKKVAGETTSLAHGEKVMKKLMFAAAVMAVGAAMAVESSIVG